MTSISNAARGRIVSAAGRYRRQSAMFLVLRLAAVINILALVGVCVFLAVNGAPALSWEFLTLAPRNMMTEGGIWPCIVGTVLLAVGAMLVAFPWGVGAAVWLHEYGSRRPVSRYIRLGVNNLAGVPSVVFSLFGLSFFVTFLGMGVSLLAGVLTLAVLTLPVIISTAEHCPCRPAHGSARHADRGHSGPVARGGRNGGHHVHGGRVLYAQNARFRVQHRHGSAVSYVRAGHGGYGN